MIAAVGVISEDEALVVAAQMGCRDSFGELYLRRVEVVRGYVRRRVTDTHLAQDLTHETFLRAWQGIDGFAGGCVEAWLTRIARNLVVDHVRLARVRHEVAVAEVRHDEVDEDDDPARMVLLHEELLEARRQMGALLAGLTADQRACLELRYFAECDVRQTAAMLGRSEGATRVLQHRALGAMRRALVSGP